MPTALSTCCGLTVASADAVVVWLQLVVPTENALSLIEDTSRCAYTDVEITKLLVPEPMPPHENPVVTLLPLVASYRVYTTPGFTLVTVKGALLEQMALAERTCWREKRSLPSSTRRRHRAGWCQ